MMTQTQDKTSELDSARSEFRQELVDAGLLIPSSVLGLYGRSGEFEDIIESIMKNGLSSV